MKAGDRVAVRFDGDDDQCRGVLVDHSDDFRNVTIQTERGGYINGMIGSIEELDAYVRTKEENEMSSER